MDPFALGSKLWFELTGQRLSARTIERLTARVGQVAAQEESALAAQMKCWDAPAPEVTSARLYVAVDGLPVGRHGVLVHENTGFHEAQTVTCYWEHPDGTRGSLYDTVRFETVAVFPAFVWSLACRCGMDKAKEAILSCHSAWPVRQHRPLRQH